MSIDSVLDQLRATARRLDGAVPFAEVLRICDHRGLDFESLRAVQETLRREGLLVDTVALPGNAEAVGSRRTHGLEDQIGWFLSSASGPPLLDREQELDLMRHVRRGDDARSKLAEGSLPPATAQDWIERGEQARSRMILCNLRLVVWVARPFLWMARDLASDVLQQGTLGLRRATELFECDRGTKFSTYATWWILQSITRYLDDHGRTVRVPSHLLQGLRRLKRVRAALHPTGELDPCREAAILARELGIDEERAMLLLQLERDTRSLDVEVEEDGAQLGDVLPDDAEPPPEQRLVDRELRETLEACMKDLDDRAQAVIALRFGLGDGVCRTLEEVGEIFSITRERVRQIEANVLTRLRHPSRARRLSAFLNHKE